MSVEELSSISSFRIPDAPHTGKNLPSGKGGFGDHLHRAEQCLPSLRLSAHAQERLSRRGIALNQDQWQKVEAAVDDAESSGSKRALIMLENLALIVGVPQRTIITIMSPTGSSHKFTSIDTAIIAR